MSLGLRLTGTIVKRLNISRGLNRILRSRLARRCLCKMGNQATATLRNGMHIQVDPMDMDGQMLLVFGTPTPNIVEVCRALLGPGQRFLDIGANYGGVGILCNDVVGSTGSIHLFEPQVDLCERIRFCLDRHNVSNVFVHPVGLLDRDGFLPLRLRPHHSGAASFVRDATSEDEVFHARVYNVATYLPRVVNGRPFGAKLDVEGAEPLLLDWLFAQKEIQFCLFETCNLGHNQQRLVWDIVSNHRIALYGIPRSMFTRTLALHRLSPLADLSRYNDVIGLQAEGCSTLPRRITPRGLALLLRPESRT